MAHNVPSPSQSHERASKEAYEYLFDLSERTGLRSAMIEADARGQQRAPKTRHVFVHPEFPWHPEMRELHARFVGNEVAEAGLREYHARIHALMTQHTDETTVLSFTDAKTHFPDLPYDIADAIPTAVLEKGQVQGKLDEDGMMKLLDRWKDFRDDDKVIVHGAAWKACTRASAFQLFAMIHLGLFFGPDRSRYSDEGKIDFDHQGTLLNALYQRRYTAEKTMIRLGIQHNTLNMTYLEGCIDTDWSHEDDTLILPSDGRLFDF